MQSLILTSNHYQIKIPPLMLFNEISVCNIWTFSNKFVPINTVKSCISVCGPGRIYVKIWLWYRLSCRTKNLTLRFCFVYRTSKQQQIIYDAWTIEPKRYASFVLVITSLMNIKSAYGPRQYPNEQIKLLFIWWSWFRNIWIIKSRFGWYWSTWSGLFLL